MYYFVNFLFTVNMFLGYVVLLPNRLKMRSYALLFTYFLTLYCWLSPFVGQYGTFLIILGGGLVIYISSGKNLLNVIFALTGHLVLILIDHIQSVPLSYLGFPLTYLQENYPVEYMLISIVFAFIILFLFRKFMIMPKLTILQTCPAKLLLLFLTELLIGLCLLAFNFIYGESVNYPTEVLSMNGFMISILTMSAVLIFYSMCDILTKNHELTVQKAQLEIMEDYTRHIEGLYDDIRVFRHDYRNILATMQDYIDTENIKDLQTYFHDKILSTTDVLSDNRFFLGKLHLIEDPALKSLLYTKLISILNNNLSLTLELTEPVPQMPIDSLLLCRVLGILLDNAIEASLESVEKTLQLAIVCTDNAFTFIIANSTSDLKVPISQLSVQGFTTKENHSGLGLTTVHRLLNPLSHVSLFTECSDGTFRQTLEIQRTV